MPPFPEAFQVAPRLPPKIKNWESLFPYPGVTLSGSTEMLHGSRLLSDEGWDYNGLA